MPLFSQANILEISSIIDLSNERTPIKNRIIKERSKINEKIGTNFHDFNILHFNGKNTVLIRACVFSLLV